LQRLAKDKHSTLLRTSVNYRRKKVYNNGPVDSNLFEIIRLDSELIELEWMKQIQLQNVSKDADSFTLNSILTQPILKIIFTKVCRKSSKVHALDTNVLKSVPIEQSILDTNAGKQLS
jgi:hypothetical protein